MKRGVKVLFAAAAVLAVAWSPTWANCSFSSQIANGGLMGGGPGGVAGVLLGGGAIGGQWWEVGFGDPATAAGNDSGLRSTAAPPAADALWVSRTVVPGQPTLNEDWFNGGSDNCLSANQAGTGAVAMFLVDGGNDYAVIAAQGTGPAAIPAGHNMDNLLTGVGGGADVPFEARQLVPAINLNIATLTPTTVVGDVLPLAASVNCFDDGSGLCADPNLVACGPAQLEQQGVGPVPGCNEGGCVGVTFQRGFNYCWDPGAACEVAGNVIPGAGLCEVAPLACTNDAFCQGFGLGNCIISPPVVVAMDSVAPGGCIFIDSVSVAGQAYDVVKDRSKGHQKFSWKVDEFAVSQMQVIGTTRGERALGAPVFPRANDGSTQTYEVLIPNSEIRFEKSFVVRVTGSDGSTADTPVE